MPVIVRGPDAVLAVKEEGLRVNRADTADVAGTVAQIKSLALAGSEIVRITVNNEAAAAAVAPIRERLDAQGIHVPLVGDFHFNGHKLLKAYPQCAQAEVHFPAISKFVILPPIRNS